MPLRVDADSVKDGRGGSVPPSTSGSKVHWNASAAHALNEFTSGGGLFGSASTSSVPRASTPTASRPAASTASPAVAKDTTASSPDKLKEGEYWTRPSIAELQKRSFAELSRLPDFTVGRVGVGEITFLKPVDLTSLKVIADIPGGVIEFTDRSCVVYVDETLKPPPGEGLNVPARISLEKCWATDRATREFIKDAEHPRHKKQMRVLQSKENTSFVSFNIETGVWVFDVPHFTRYGLDDSDDEDDDEYEESSAPTQVNPLVAAFFHDGSRTSQSERPPPPVPKAVRSPTPEVVIEVDAPSEHSAEAEAEEEEEEEEPVVEDASARPWSSRIDLDPRRVNVMQASLFADNDDDEEVGDLPITEAPFNERRPAQSSFQPRFGADTSMEPTVTGVSTSLYI